MPDRPSFGECTWLFLAGLTVVFGGSLTETLLCLAICELCRISRKLSASVRKNPDA